MLAKKLLACYTLWPGIVTQPSTCFCSFGLQVKAIEKLFLKQLNGASNRVGYLGSGNTVRSVWQVRMDTSIVTCFYPALCFSKGITWALDFHGGSVRVACLGLLQLANSSLVNIFKIESFPIYDLKNPHFRGAGIVGRSFRDQGPSSWSSVEPNSSLALMPLQISSVVEQWPRLPHAPAVTLPRLLRLVTRFDLTSTGLHYANFPSNCYLIK